MVNALSDLSLTCSEPREKNHTVCFVWRTYRSLASKLKKCTSQWRFSCQGVHRGLNTQIKGYVFCLVFCLLWQPGNLSLFITEVLAMMLNTKKQVSWSLAIFMWDIRLKWSVSQPVCVLSWDLGYIVCDCGCWINALLFWYNVHILSLWY